MVSVDVQKVSATLSRVPIPDLFCNVRDTIPKAIPTSAGSLLLFHATRKKPTAKSQLPGFPPRCFFAPYSFIPGPQSLHLHSPAWYEPSHHTIWTKTSSTAAPQPKIRPFSQPAVPHKECLFKAEIYHAVRTGQAHFAPSPEVHISVQSCLCRHWNTWRLSQPSP